MGNLLYGGKRPNSITYQGKQVQTVKYNGVTVWNYSPAQHEDFICIARTDGGDIGNMGASTGGTKDFIPNSQYSVVRIGWKKIEHDGTISAISYKKNQFIKIKKESPLMVVMSPHVRSTPHDKCFEIVSTLVDKKTNKNISCSVEGDYWNHNGGSNNSSVGLKLTIECSREIENHDFTDSTSDHEHLDWSN